MSAASGCTADLITRRHAWQGTGLDTDDVLGLVDTRACHRCGAREVGRYDGPGRKVRRWFRVSVR